MVTIRSRDEAQAVLDRAKALLEEAEVTRQKIASLLEEHKQVINDCDKHLVESTRLLAAVDAANEAARVSVARSRQIREEARALSPAVDEAIASASALIESVRSSGFAVAPTGELLH